MHRHLCRHCDVDEYSHVASAGDPSHLSEHSRSPSDCGIVGPGWWGTALRRLFQAGFARCFFGAKPCSHPLRRASYQADRWEEYRPSWGSSRQNSAAVLTRRPNNRREDPSPPRGAVPAPPPRAPFRRALVAQGRPTPSQGPGPRTSARTATKERARSRAGAARGTPFRDDTG